MTRRDAIRLRGVRQHNLKGVDLDIPLGALVAVTGVSGSGKSSLAFDTLYAEGERRYVETFSAYTRQFLERLPRPDADRVDGIPPAIAIDQTAAVKTSRSTVGTMTDVDDYLKLLFARAADLFCPGCGEPVRRDDVADVLAAVRAGPFPVIIAAPIPLGGLDDPTLIARGLRAQGIGRAMRGGEAVRIEDLAVSDLEGKAWIDAVIDRIAGPGSPAARVRDSIEQAFRLGRGRLRLHTDGGPRAFSQDPICTRCDRSFERPRPSLFAFNNPHGACPSCHGFGRIIDLDHRLVVPDPSRSLAAGAIRPFRTPRGRRAFSRMLDFCRKNGIPIDVPFEDLPEDSRRAVIDGRNGFGGVRGFFRKLERKKYKLHVRVFLARFRGYETCPACRGSRLRPEATWFRLEGKTLPEISSMTIGEARAWFEAREASGTAGAAAALLVREIRARLEYLDEVGLGYLTLDRPSRTLSGGEVQRVNLTAALGSRLVNTLFVLDEPSIGLHARDSARLVRILRKIRDRGNTVVVVEHDPEIIARTDRIVDLGPGAGERGGEIIYAGPASGLLDAPGSITGEYLAGRARIPARARRRTPSGRIRIRNAREHNLKGIDVDIPLGVLVAVTGVSGSGKSTLIDETLYRAWKARRGEPVGEPGLCDAIEGLDEIAEMVLMDQSPIGRTPRANPATYSGVLGPIRKLLAASPLARSRRYTEGHFSFNVARGRCPVCEGDGFERVEMQFLSDIRIPCDACRGTRFRAEVLEVKWRGLSIADILGLTFSEAAEIFAKERDIVSRLRPFLALGLGYLRLGQPLDTLSGGEAQRLKLIGRTLGRSRGRALVLLDEPTTGLHPADVARLLETLHALVDKGQSICVIEHNLDCIRAADHVIDLGPEGGDAGGEVVATGTPDEIRRAPRSITGAWLRRGIRPPARRTDRASGSAPRPAIVVRGAREHNLRDIDVEIPRDRFVVVTGLSGAGKSTLLYDIVFAEGQRRYLDCLSPYARQFVEELHKPDVDHVEGIPPTVAIEQRTTIGGRKSTVGTITEIYGFLRLLFARAGIQHCPQCGVPVVPRGEDAVVREVRRRAATGGRLLVPAVRGKKGFHGDLIDQACRAGREEARIDGRVVPIHPGMRLDRYRPHDVDWVAERFDAVPRDLPVRIRAALQTGRGVVIYLDPAGEETILATERSCPRCRASFEAPDPQNFSFHSPRGMCTACDGEGVVGEGAGRRCAACGGTRIRSPWRDVRVGGRTIGDLARAPIDRMAADLAGMSLEGREALIARPILKEVEERIGFLRDLGLGYLALDRSVHTLSAGEAQRIRLAAQLGSNLRGVCYILDEPTIGLHARDGGRLIETLRKLRDRGNSVLVIEHDDATIAAADHVIEMGPGPGSEGGRVVAAGTLDALRRNPRSPTGRYFAGAHRVAAPAARRFDEAIEVAGARGNNLKDVNARFPLGAVTVVTGVSGAGKSTLVEETLLAGVEHRLRTGRPGPAACRDIRNWKAVERAIAVDQAPIGRTPRSVPATYTKLWDRIRRIFAASPEAKVRGYGPERFSFNGESGACERCGGQGRIRLEMHFLPDLFVDCDLCGGARFRPDVLAVLVHGRSAADVLAMTVSEARALFEPYADVAAMLGVLEDLGLGYLELGQPSPSLSGGEAQRIKLAAELGKPRRRPTLYVLDEPTTGLHMEDVAKLLEVLRRLAARGDAVVVIEHNREVIAAADHVIDLGPEGGDAGGRVLYQGPVAGLAKARRISHTARAMEGHIESSRPTSAHHASTSDED
ncbi:MAG: excinuclease ABC subunit UvrA [Planctomycetes bacterium]|nr:excinuclease ABC subunit UvrA [Planctomycetota bacterium]